MHGEKFRRNWGMTFEFPRYLAPIHEPGVNLHRPYHERLTAAEDYPFQDYINIIPVDLFEEIVSKIRVIM